MRRTLAAALVAGGLVVGAVGVPAVATASSPTPAVTAVSHRLSAVSAALSGLVKDGTLTQAQADKVATTLKDKLPARGHGPRHVRGGISLKAAAQTLRLTPKELKSALREGQTLAEIAQTQKVAVGTLVDTLVRAAEARLATAVLEGRLTSEQADQRKEGLRERITKAVKEGFLAAAAAASAGTGPTTAGTRSSHATPAPEVIPSAIPTS